MAHQNHEKWVCDLLHGNNQAFPKLSDLPVFWRATPPEELDPDHPGLRTRESLVEACIILADTNPWAKAGLNNLLDYLSETGEPVPKRLKDWAFYRDTAGLPGPRPGRPKESERDHRVLTVFEMLRDERHTRNEAIDIIADCINYSPDTIRSIIHKHRGALPRRRRW